MSFPANGDHVKVARTLCPLETAHKSEKKEAQEVHIDLSTSYTENMTFVLKAWLVEHFLLE